MFTNPNKLLGQNFLRCSWVASTMIKTAELNSEDVVLEVGAGTGVLTKELVKRAKKVIAVEKDKNLIVQYLRPLEQKHKNLEIVEGDILTHLSFLEKNLGGQVNSYKLVSNIPYYLTSRLLRLLLEKGPQPKTIVLTLQKEVAERICAKPPKMNLLALSIQVFGKPEIVKTVPADCFWPKPKIDSTIIKISQISDGFFAKNKTNPEVFFKVVKTSFANKRKMLVNTIEVSPRYNYRGETSIVRKDFIRTMLKAVGLSEKSRPEELSLNQWIVLVKKLL